MKNILILSTFLFLLLSCFSEYKSKGKLVSGKMVFTGTSQLSPSASRMNPLPSVISVTFPDEINMATVSSQDFTITGTGSCAPLPLLAAASSGQVMNLTLNTVSCLHGDQIILKVSYTSIWNRNGKRGTGESTKVYTLNTDSAVIPSLLLQSGSYQILPADISLTFDSSTDMTSVTADLFNFTGTGSCPAHPAHAVSISGRTATVSFSSSGCSDGDEIKVEVDFSELKDDQGRNGSGVISRIFKLDQTGPDVSGFVADINSGDFNPLPAELKIVLPAEIDIDSISSSDFLVSGTGSCPVLPLTTLTKTLQEVTLSFDLTGCANADEIIVQLPLQGVKDLAGNNGTGTLEKSFRLVSAIPSQPHWSVQDGPVSALPQTVTLTFPDTIDMTTVSQTAISVSGTGTCPVTPLTQISQAGSTATLVITTSGCANGDSLTVAIDMSQIENTVGVTGSGIMTKTFTLDSSGPTTPVFGIDSGSFAAIPTIIPLEFAADTDMSTVSPTSITAVGTGCPVNAISQITYSGTTAWVFLDTGTCSDNGQIQLKVDLSLIEDTLGNNGAGIVSRTFVMDTDIPSFPASSSPSGTYQTLPTSLTLTFSPDIDDATIEAGDVSVLGTGNCLTQPVTATNISGRTVSLSLSNTGCGHGDSFVVLFNMSGITNLSGTSGQGTFRNTYVQDSEGPAAPTTLASGGTVSLIPGSIGFTFPSDTIMSSVSTADFSVNGTGSCSVSISSGAVNGFEYTVNFDPSSCGDSDSLSITASTLMVEDALGNRGTNATVVSFTLDSSGPALPIVTPAGGTVASLPSSVIVTFPGDTLMSSVGLNDFQISGVSCAPAIQSISVNGNIAQLNLSGINCPHASSITFTINGSGITDSLGNAGSASLNRTYTLDTLAPSLPVVNIASGRFSSLPGLVEFTFDTGTDMDSVSETDFSANSTGNCGGSLISQVNKAGHVATVQLNSTNCPDGSTLTLEISMDGVNDLLGNHAPGSVRRDYALDKSGPAAATVNLSSGTLSSLPASIIFTFSNDTDMNSVTSADFTVSGSGSCPVSPLTSVSKSGQTATLLLTSSGCVTGDSETVQLSMTGVTDDLGNSGTGNISRVFTLDNTGPANATTVSSAIMSVLPGSITFTFSSDTDMNSVTSADFSVNGSGSCPVSPLTSLSKSGQTATLNLSTSGCQTGNSETIQLSMSGVTDALGNAGSGTVSVSFTLDNTGPAIATTVPSAVVNAIPGSITFNFSGDTDMNSVTTADFIVSGTGSCPVNPLTSLSKSGQTATLVLNSSGCATGNTETVLLSMAGVTDALGNPGVGSVSAVFTLDITGPAPAVANLMTSTLRTLPASMTFTFSSDTDMGSVTAGDFTVIGNGSCPASPLLSLSKSGHVATLNFNSSGCVTGNNISVSLSMSGVTDDLGNAGTGFVSSIFTLDNTGPATAVANLSSSIHRILPGSMNFTFSSDTDMTSVTAADFTVTGSGSCPASPLSSISKSGQVATLNLISTGCVTTNTISVQLSMTGVTDSLGNPGSGTVSAVFTLDNTGPANPVVNIVDGLQVVMPTSVTYTFASDVDMSTVTQSAFTVTGSGGCMANSLSSVTVSGRVATVNLRSCAFGTQRIDLDMPSVKDTVGNPGTGTFTKTYYRLL